MSILVDILVILVVLLLHLLLNPLLVFYQPLILLHSVYFLFLQSASILLILVLVDQILQIELLIIVLIIKCRSLVVLLLLSQLVHGFLAELTSVEYVLYDHVFIAHYGFNNQTLAYRTLHTDSESRRDQCQGTFLSVLSNYSDYSKQCLLWMQDNFLFNRCLWRLSIRLSTLSVWMMSSSICKHHLWLLTEHVLILELSVVYLAAYVGTNIPIITKVVI